ncbi:hypothetical protein [Paraburkholderia rhynchosiae]|uniref:Uncharacterized protein n=1 Tax=Paraburkholderia rhynchosiae TaxID=487049 RepID=A0A6J5C6H3_9BURK|nr:hypothetical protein [Paraburkholderia rhynchosiae]CAB3728685.1 hypothetical protein LMG27174_05598 [Paraburkholderia rhynchosiae]
MEPFNDDADVVHFINGRRVPGSGTRKQPIFKVSTAKPATAPVLAHPGTGEHTNGPEVAGLQIRTEAPDIMRRGECRQPFDR